MKQKFNQFRRCLLILPALALALLGMLPLLTNTTYAAQVQNRSIQMSDSTPSGSGGGTNVTYNVSFQAQTTGAIQGVDIDFCGGGVSDTPIIGDSNCSLPTGMSLSGVGVSGVTGLSPTSGWSASVINSSHTVEVSNGSGASVTAPVTINFQLTGITNPSTNNKTFYARITTFATTAAAAAYTSSSPGSYVDYGGIALSTGYTITVTAKVMEQLTFCVSGATITTCSSTSTPAVNLGRVVGTNNILDSAAVYTGNVYTQTSTNASHGIAVTLKTTSSTTCGGLSSNGGTSCTYIPAVASGATTPQTITAGTAAFGMCVTPGASDTATAPYNNSGCTKYGLDDSSATKTVSTYGSQIFSSTGPMNQDNDTLTYAATASNTTPAGIYSTTNALIATGTF